MRRRLSHQAGEASIGQAVEAAEGGVLGVGRDAAGGEGRGIGEAEMPIRPQDEDRPADARGIEFRERRIAAAGTFVQPVEGAPMAGRHRRAPRANAGEQGIPRLDDVGRDQRPGAQPQRIGIRMRVAVHDAGQHAAALGVEDGGARPRQVADGGVIADRDDAAIQRGQRPGLGARGVHRSDAGVQEDEVGMHHATNRSIWSRSRYQPPTMGRNHGVPV